MLVHSLPTKSRKRLARDVMIMAAAHAGRIHDVTDLVKMAVPMAVFVGFSNVNCEQTRL